MRKQCVPGPLLSFIGPGNEAIVRYDGLEFPGEITSCDETDAEVNVMHRSSSAWRWPTNPDKIFYEHANILRQINPPKAAGHRDQFTFDDIQIIKLRM